MYEPNPLLVSTQKALGDISTVPHRFSQRLRVLVVDDDRVARELLRVVLERDNFECVLAGSGEQALELVAKETFPIIITDVNMFEINGHELLAYLKRMGSPSVVILMTGYGSLEGAMDAIHQGAFDYLSKPFNAEEVAHLAMRAAQHWKSMAEPHLRREPSAPVRHRAFIGKSPSIVNVYKTVAKASLTSSNILITGESGTGKELVAKATHANSARRHKPFITINCGALTETLLESELFGHFKGSFTGAIANKRGLFEEADGGTIFLDEIGDISPALQVKLLRVIQDGEFKPVGSTEVRKVDARVIAATHRDLEVCVKENRFREDLYYRLKVIHIELPPLRERIEDLAELANHFLLLYADRTGKVVTGISSEALQLLYAYPWPGNIRELEHAIERAMAMTSTTILYREDFPSEIINFGKDKACALVPTPSTSLMVATNQSLEQMERAHIIRVLQDVNFNKSKAAEILGIDRATLYRKAQRYAIPLSEEKST